MGKLGTWIRRSVGLKQGCLLMSGRMILTNTVRFLIDEIVNRGIRIIAMEKTLWLRRIALLVRLVLLLAPQLMQLMAMGDTSLLCRRQ